MCSLFYSSLTGLLCFLFLQNAYALPDLYFRSIRSGQWNNVATWETAQDQNFSIDLRPALVVPDHTHRSIVIQTNDTVVISAATSMDEVIVEAGAVLVYGNFPSSVLSISDGPGIDLAVNGTFEDSGPVNIVWETTQTSWALGENATIVRTKSTSATQWRDHYDQGIATIPASSTWILRKQSTDQPSIAGVNFYYGNLKIENTTAVLWNANLVGSKITGINSAPIIKGNFEIGTSGTSGVKFYTQNSALLRIQVKGNLVIGQGSEFRLEDASATTGASGLTLFGDLIVHGILSYDPVDASNQNRTVAFTGQNNQYIRGNGSINLYALYVQKPSGDLILNRTLSVDQKVILTAGALDLNEQLLEIRNSDALAIERTNGWVKSEKTNNTSRLSWNIGAATGIHEFPFGKDASHYLPVSILVTSGDLGTVTIATYGTASNNQPLPVLPELVTNLDVNGNENSQHTVDRFWYLTKTGTTGLATLTLSYSEEERPAGSTPLFVNRYNPFANVWEALCCQTQQEMQRIVTVTEVEDFSALTLMEENDALFVKKPTQLLTRAQAVESFVYPNPCRDVLFVVHEQAESGSVQIELYNALGIKVCEKEFSANPGANLFRIDFSAAYEKGLLYIRATDFNTINEFKVLRE